MKASSVLAAAFLATSGAATVMEFTPIVTRQCIQTPTPLALSGVSTAPRGVVDRADCLRRCVNSESCVGVLWDVDADSICTIFDWITTAFDGEDYVESWRCGSQLPQENIQLQGTEIANVSATTADQCSYKCEATAGCYAYSWSNLDGGSCSLKSEKPSAIAGPYDGSVLSGEVYKCGRPYFDMELKGMDLGSAPGSLWSDCCAVCRRTSGCDGFSWSEDNGGTCWLKGKVTPELLDASSGFTSALMLGNGIAIGPAPCVETDSSLAFGGKTVWYPGRRTVAECREICLSSNCAAFSMVDDYYCRVSSWIGMAVENGAGKSWRCGHQLPQEKSNYVGLTIGTASTKDADRCSYKCDKTAYCWAYSWAKANNGTCIMKSNKPVTLSEPFDGSNLSGEAYKCTEPQDDLDVVGADLASVQRTVWSDCCGVCRRTTGCEAFSWSDYNGGTCWLKTKVARGKVKRAPGVVSSYIFAQKSTCTQSFKHFNGEAVIWQLTSREDCERMCLFANCVGYKWTSKFGGPNECQIISWVESLEDPNSDSSADSWWCRPQLFQENGNYAGADIGNKRTTDAALCSYACEETAACSAYTWASGVCYMKSTRPNQVTGPSDGSVISGEPFRAWQIARDEDIVGHDVGSVQREWWPECVGVCRRTSGCYNVVWSSYNGGTCWLKGKMGEDEKKAVGTVLVSLIAPWA